MRREYQGGIGEKEKKVHSRDKRLAVMWVLLIMVQLSATPGDIVAESGSGDSQAPWTVSNGVAPDTLSGGPGGSHGHGDPDDFDFVTPVGAWIHALLIGLRH